MNDELQSLKMMQLKTDTLFVNENITILRTFVPRNGMRKGKGCFYAQSSFAKCAIKKKQRKPTTAPKTEYFSKSWTI